MMDQVFSFQLDIQLNVFINLQHSALVTEHPIWRLYKGMCYHEGEHLHTVVCLLLIVNKLDVIFLSSL